MKGRRFFSVLLLMAFVAAVSSFIAHPAPVQASGEAQKKLKSAESFGGLPLYFIENRGQMDGRIKFYENGLGHSVLFTDRGAAFRFFGNDGDSSQNAVVFLSPIGMRDNVDILGVGEQNAKVNYLIGREPGKWKTGIPTYQSVVYQEAYPGIDLKFYGSNRKLEYDVVVKPGGDVSEARLQYDGVEGYEITEEGHLTLKIKDGKVLHQMKPVVYQLVDGKRVEREGRYKMTRSAQGSFVCAFDVPEYDKSRTLVIDPVVLIYSTYIGGVDDDYASGIAIDSTGNLYVTGHTDSFDFPMGENVDTLNGLTDAFVFKLNSAGSALVYATYLGGESDDFGASIVVNSAGHAYVTGFTYSANFPVAGAEPYLNAHQPGGRSDAFLSVLDAAGAALEYSTFIGGSACDYGYSIALDTITPGTVYLVGETESGDFPRLTPYQNSLKGETDAFVTKLNLASGLVYSTYLGGEQDDGARAVAVNNSGEASVTGFTYSSLFPQALFSTSKGGGRDAFVTKFTISGSLSYSTFLGGYGDDYGRAIAVDLYGNTYVAGETSSVAITTLNIVFPTAVQNTYAGGTDAFVARFKYDGSNLEYFTWLGGTDYDSAHAIAVDGSQNIYVAGETLSEDFPIQGHFQAYNAGYADSFVTKIKSGFGAFGFSTYLGGNGNDNARGIVLDSSQQVYLAGFTSSDDFPVTQSPIPIQGSRASDFAFDAFVTRLTHETGGALQVTLEPQGAIDAGAKWKVDDEAWMSSGETFSDIAVGPHTVYFKGSISGWTEPEKQSVTIENGTATLKVAYASQKGSLKVTISPQGAIDAGAKWKLDDEAWMNSGETLSNIDVGAHTLYFSDISGWSTPSIQIVTITKDFETSASAEYYPKYGSLIVNITPQGAINAGAKWRVDNGDWLAGGESTSILVGEHTIEYFDIEGWNPPDSTTATVSDSATTTVTGAYTTEDLGYLSVLIKPKKAITSGAKWAVDGTEDWQDNGAQLTLSVGSHTVQFKSVAGLSAPVEQTVTISKDQFATIKVKYTKAKQSSSLKKKRK